MSEEAKTIQIKYLIKIPQSTEFTKEQLARFSYIQFAENLDRMKTFNNYPPLNSNLNSYFLMDSLHNAFKQFYFLSLLLGFNKLFLGPKTTKLRRLWGFIKYTGIPSLIIAYTFTTKSMLYYEYLKKDLLKTESDKDIQDYYKFKNKHF